MIVVHTLKIFFDKELSKWELNTHDKNLEKFGDTTYNFDGVDGFIRYTSNEEMIEFITKNTKFKILEYITRDELTEEDEVVQEFGNNTTFWVLKK